MMTSDYPDPSFSGDFLPVERVCRGTVYFSRAVQFHKVK